MEAEPPKADLPKRKRRWFQFSLRTLLILTAIVAIASAWLGKRIEQKRKERDAVAAIIESGGYVRYDYQYMNGRVDLNAEPAAAGWLRKLCGDNFFSEVVWVRANGTGVVFPDVLTELRVLELNKTNVGDAELVNLKRMTQLEELVLSETAVTDAGLACLEGLTRLRYLDVSATQVSDEGLAHLKDLTQLQNLSLRATRVTDTGLGRLGGLRQLQQLFLGGTQITDAGLIHLKGMTELQRLTLDGSKITDSGLKHIKALTKLQSLDLRESAVTAAGVADLQKALPNCVIYFYEPTRRGTGNRGRQ
jgi:hypothetical protein